MILVLQYPGEEKERRDQLLNDAKRLQKKLFKKGVIHILIEGLENFRKQAPEVKNDEKLHLFCHGNWGELSGAGVTGKILIDTLWTAGLQRTKVEKITVHACFSGSPTNQHGAAHTPIILQMANYFKDKGRKMTVKGAAGEEVTSSGGSSYIVAPGMSWPAGENPNADREKFLLKQYCLPKNDKRKQQRPAYFTQNRSAPMLIE